MGYTRTAQISRRRARNAASRTRRGPRGTYTAAWNHADAESRTYLTPPAYTEIGEVPLDVRQRATEKLALIQRFVREGCPRGRLVEYARYAVEANGGDRVPPYQTLNTWVHRYRRWGLLGLADAVRADAGQFRTLSTLDEAILEAGLIGGQLDVAALVRFVAQCAPGREPLSYDVVRRWVHSFISSKPGLFTAATQGLGGYRSQHRLALPTPLVLPGAVVAIDSTVADVWVRVPSTDTPGAFEAVRPVLTICEDVGSRTLLTFNLSLAPVSAAIITGTVRRFVVTGANYDGLPTLGIPEAVRTNGGSEHAGQFRKALRQLGVEIITGDHDTPEVNGHVERLIGTCSTQCLQNLLGYSPTSRRFDPYEAPETDGKRSAPARQYEPYAGEVLPQHLQTLAELTESVRAWAVRYNHRPHPALTPRSPLITRAIQQVEALANPTTPR